MQNDSLRRYAARPVVTPKERPKIWSSGSQRLPFDVRATARASLLLSREGVAPLLAWTARMARRAAVNVRNGVGQIPEDKLGRVGQFLPSHLRVAHWIKNLAAIFAHASANADTEVKRGNALVAEVEPHLWALSDLATPEPTPVQTLPVEPVVLPEPEAADPLAAIRDDLSGKPAPKRRASAVRAARAGRSLPPAPTGQVGTMAIQMTGYVLGWGSAIVALPYGLGRALWLHFSGIDLRKFDEPG